MIQESLELRGICKSFGGIKALDDISFEPMADAFMVWQVRTALESQRQ